MLFININVLLFLIIVLFKYTISLDIHVNYQSNNNYIDNDCGNSTYPCRSFKDASNKINNNNNNDYILNIYISQSPTSNNNNNNNSYIYNNNDQLIINNNQFKEIIITNSNNNNNNNNQYITIDGSNNKVTFILLKTSISASIRISNIQFTNWDNFNIINPDNFSVYFDNIIFINSSQISPYDSTFYGNSAQFTNSIFNNNNNQIVKFPYNTTYINNCTFININRNLDFSGYNQLSITNCSIYNNIMSNKFDPFISIDNYKSIVISDINFNNNSAIYTIINILNNNNQYINSTFSINNFNFYNNIIPTPSSEIYLFKLSKIFYDILIDFNNINFINNTNDEIIGGMILNSNGESVIGFNNVYSTLKFKNIFIISNSIFSINNSNIQSIESIYKGNNNHITAYNSTYNLNQDSNNNNNNNSSSNSTNNISINNNKNNLNKNIAIIVPVVLFSFIFIILGASLYMAIQRRKKLKKERVKESKRKNRMFDDISFEDDGAIDQDMGTGGSSGFVDSEVVHGNCDDNAIPNFLNDIDESSDPK